MPAAVRLAQLRTNVVRLRSLSGNLGNRYVVCNIPAARIEAIEGGVAVSRHTAVAGKPDRPSPDINSKIVEVNFNPYWTVPVSIVRRDLIPKMQAEPDYLTSNHIRIFDMKGEELTPSQINWYSEEAVNYRFKQDPGDFNSLGSIRINFPSKDGVYMHDTPAKGLFGEDMRFHSSGCVRVQNVRELVNWLLQETPGWSRQEIDAVIKSKRAQGRPGQCHPDIAVLGLHHRLERRPTASPQFREDICAIWTVSQPAGFSAAMIAASAVFSAFAHRRRDLSAQKLDRAHQLFVRQGADAHLHEIARVPERLVLAQDFLDHLLRRADRKMPACRASAIEMLARRRRPAAFFADMRHLRRVAREKLVGGSLRGFRHVAVGVDADRQLLHVVAGATRGLPEQIDERREALRQPADDGERHRQVERAGSDG